ncbi:MAG: hypothetical protein ACK550_13720 [Synechococcaceae cyanobacterium]|jgi:hypothetical protein
MATATPAPCLDCVEVHGDDPAQWLEKWPAGADWSPRHGAHLCEGCEEERDDWERVEPGPLGGVDYDA